MDSSRLSTLDMNSFEAFSDGFDFSFPPNDFYTTAYEVQPAPPAPTIRGPRQFRSRKSRPCDFCRSRKTACKIDVSTPCLLCRTYGRECTFVEQPKKRKRSSITTTTNDSTKHPLEEPTPLEFIDQCASSTSPHSVPSSSSVRTPPDELHASLPSGLTCQPPTKVALKRKRSDLTDAEGNSAISSRRNSNHKVTNGAEIPKYHPTDANGQKWLSLSFAPQRTQTAVYVADTGEVDPYLLRRYRYGDDDDQSVLSRITYMRMQNIGESKDNVKEDRPSETYFMLTDEDLANKDEPRNENSVVNSTHEEVAGMFEGDLGVRMVKLFFRFVYPYFPVLSREQWLSSSNSIRDMLDDLPLSLLAALYATTLPFLLYDDVLATSMLNSPPPISQLYRAAWLGITQEIHTPHLETFQACLLLLQRPATNRYLMHTPLQWSMVAWTSAFAQTIGLSVDSSRWSRLPVWERRLRGRLFWAAYVMDKWAMLGAGMPSHIKSEDFDVRPPTLFSPAADISSSRDFPDDPLSVEPHFYHLTTLTMIVADIVDTYYTTRARSRTSKNFSLSLELAKPLRIRLREWKVEFAKSMPEHQQDASTEIELDGNRSLKLAYIIATMTLYRALLRPLENAVLCGEDLSHLNSGREAVLMGAKACSKEAIDFAESLGPGAWDAFWHSWSSANFAMASSFLVRVSVNVTTPAEKEELRDLVLRWRRVLRPGSSASGNGMMGLALLRIEGSLREGLLDNNGAVIHERSQINGL